MTAYYNENDMSCCQWLHRLMESGLIEDGHIDPRDIRDVGTEALAGYDRVHLFAGIGVWDVALSQVGWPKVANPVWTASCPCQPFSVAGKRGGTSDERHLWPEVLRLIRASHPERKPVALFGEQVASKDGQAWLDTVQLDMEGEGYACGSCATVACGFGAPHKRQRLYFVADTDISRPQGREPVPERPDKLPARSGGLENQQSSPGPVNGFWRDADWLLCQDGKWRPTQPGTQPLAHGAVRRTRRIRGAGNALCLPQAQGFIEAYLEII